MTREEWDKLTADEQWSLYQSTQLPVTLHTLTFAPADTALGIKSGFPPIDMMGDMVPMFYDGQWWVDWMAYHKRRVANGDEKE